MTETQLTRDREQLEAATDIAVSPESRRFRASTYDEALAAAIDELGAGIQVVEANRIRRGGLGGFFATDLGVEITVVPDESPAATTGAAAAPTESRGATVNDRAPAPGTLHGTIRPYLPEDLSPDGGEDGSLGGQSLGMTDARLQQLLDRTERTERADHRAATIERTATGGPADGIDHGDSAPPSFADQLAVEERSAGLPTTDDGTGEPGPLSSAAAAMTAADADSGLSAEALATLREGVPQHRPETAPDDLGGPEHVVADGDAEPSPLPKRYRPKLPAARHEPVARSAPSGYLDDPADGAAEETPDASNDGQPASAIADVIADSIAADAGELAETIGDLDGEMAGETAAEMADKTADDVIDELVDAHRRAVSEMYGATAGETTAATAASATSELPGETTGSMAAGMSGEIDGEPGLAMSDLSDGSPGDGYGEAIDEVTADEPRATSDDVNDDAIGGASATSPGELAAHELPETPVLPVLPVDVPTAPMASSPDESPSTNGVRLVLAAGGAASSGQPIAAVGRTAPSGFLHEYPSSSSTSSDDETAPDDESAPDTVAGSNCAVVVPMAESIDEPMTMLTAPPAVPAVPAPTSESLLVAAATDRLVDELGTMAAAEGSRLDELDRLSVSVTTTEGDTIEMTVELADERD